MDCREEVYSGEKFCWDNKRNRRICNACVEKLKELAGFKDEDEDKPIKKAVPWDAAMSVKPWEIGNFDINSWPAHIQKEYVDLSRSKEQYDKGLAAAQLRLSNQQANAN